MWISSKRLQRDVARWRANNWLTAEGAVQIQKELAVPGREVGLASVLGVLAACLLGFAAMSFVAANWQAMPRLGRLGVLFGGHWLAYLAAGVAFSRNHPWLAHAAVLLGACIFGASIMLIAQMFHIDTHPPTGVLVWAIGALAAAVAVPSPPTLGLSALLVGLWGGWETSILDGVYWPFLIGWAAIVIAAYVMRWAPGRHFAGLLFAGWAVALGPYLPGYGGFKLVVAVGGGALALGALLSTLDGDLKGVSRAVLGYGLIIVGAALFSIQFIETISNADLVLWAILALALTLGAIAWGMHTENRGLVWLGYAGFAIEVLGLYFKTVGTLLGNAGFFLSAGVIVLILAAVAYRIHRQPTAAEAAP